MRKMQIENVLTSLSQLALLSAVLEAHNQEKKTNKQTNKRRPYVLKTYAVLLLCLGNSGHLTRVRRIGISFFVSFELTAHQHQLGT
jgi:hypothetical protein